MHWKFRKIYAVPFVIFVVIASGFVLQENKIVDFKSIKLPGEQINACEMNSDCVIVRENCCNQTSINKKYSAEWNSKEDQQCAESSCTTCDLEGCNILQGKLPICANNRCQAVNLNYCGSGADCIAINSWFGSRCVNRNWCTSDAYCNSVITGNNHNCECLNQVCIK